MRRRNFVIKRVVSQNKSYSVWKRPICYTLLGVARSDERNNAITFGIHEKQQLQLYLYKDEWRGRNFEKKTKQKKKQRQKKTFSC